MKFSGLLSVLFALVMVVMPGKSLTAQSDGAYRADAVSRPTCPVSMATPARSGNTLHLKFRNSTSTKIRGILFGAAYYDGNQVAHVIEVLTDEHRIIRPGVVKTGDLNISHWRSTDFTGWAAWPSKILYTDGTSWQIGPNAMGCVVSYWRDGQRPRTLLASDILPHAPVEMEQGAESGGGGGSDR